MATNSTNSKNLGDKGMNGKQKVTKALLKDLMKRTNEEIEDLLVSIAVAYEKKTYDWPPMKVLCEMYVGKRLIKDFGEVIKSIREDLKLNKGFYVKKAVIVKEIFKKRCNAMKHWTIRISRVCRTILKKVLDVARRIKAILRVMYHNLTKRTTAYVVLLIKTTENYLMALEAIYKGFDGTLLITKSIDPALAKKIWNDAEELEFAIMFEDPMMKNSLNP